MSLADDLVFAQDFRNGVGSTATADDGTVGTFAGSSPPTWDVLGEGLTFPGGASTVSWVDYGVHAGHQDLWYSPAGAASAPMTVFARVRWISGQGGIVEHDSNAGVGWTFGMGSAAGDAGLELTQERATTDKQDGAGTAVTTNHWANVAVASPGSVAACNGVFYVSTVPWPLTLTPVVGSGNALTDALESLIIGRKRSAGSIAAGTFNGTIACVYIWRRLLDATELAELEADPFAPLTAGVTPPAVSEVLTGIAVQTAPTYSFVSLTMNLEAQFIETVVRNDDGLAIYGRWIGDDALVILHLLNTANLTSNSLIKRMMNYLIALGELPAGSVSGTPL